MCRKSPRHHRTRPQELFRYFQNRLAPSSLPQKCCCFPWAACCKSDGSIPQFMAGCHYDNFLQLILLETLRILTNRTANKKHSSFSIHLYHNCCAFGRGRRIRTLGTRFWRPLLYQLSYSGNKLLFTGCKGTSLFEKAKRISVFFRNILVG